MAKRKQHQVPRQPASEDQSGSAGRRTDENDRGHDKDTGQGRYGQSGLGGKQERETQGQARYRRSGPDGSEQADSESNRGSGRADRESNGVDHPGPEQKNAKDSR
jgi:hypothetical protein